MNTVVQYLFIFPTAFSSAQITNHNFVLRKLEFTEFICLSYAICSG